MKKVLIFILIVLVSLVGFIYNAFNGNPVSKYLNKKDIQKYISTNYSDKDLEVIKVDYNINIRNYITTVQLRKEGTEYLIEKLDDGSYLDGYYNAEVINPRFSGRMGEELSKIIYKDLKDKISELSSVAVKFEIKGGKYPINMDYTREMDEKPEILINFQGSSITEEAFLDKVLLVKEEIIRKGYKPRGFHFRYNEPGENSALIYSMKLEENQINFTSEQLRGISLNYDEETKAEFEEFLAKNKLLLGVYILGGLLIVISIGIFITILEKGRSIRNLN